MYYNIYNTAIKLRALQGLACLRAVMLRIELARELFIMDIEKIEPC